MNGALLLIDDSQVSGILPDYKPSSLCQHRARSFERRLLGGRRGIAMQVPHLGSVQRFVNSTAVLFDLVDFGLLGTSVNVAVSCGTTV